MEMGDVFLGMSGHSGWELQGEAGVQGADKSLPWSLLPEP